MFRKSPDKYSAEERTMEHILNQKSNEDRERREANRDPWNRINDFFKPTPFENVRKESPNNSSYVKESVSPFDSNDRQVTEKFSVVDKNQGGRVTYQKSTFEDQLVGGKEEVKDDAKLIVTKKSSTETTYEIESTTHFLNEQYTEKDSVSYVVKNNPGFFGSADVQVEKVRKLNLGGNEFEIKESVSCPDSIKELNNSEASDQSNCCIM